MLDTQDIATRKGNLGLVLPGGGARGAYQAGALNGAGRYRPIRG